MEELELRVVALLDSSTLSTDPDWETVERFVMDTYASRWANS